MRRIALAAALCFAAACGTETTVAPPAEPFTPVVGGGPAFASASCVLAPVQSSWLPRRLPCGARVRVTSSDQTISSKLQTAINTWSGAGLGQNGLPSLSTSVSSPSHTVVITGSGSPETSTTWYCGDTQPGTLSMTIFRSANKADCGTQLGGPAFSNATQIAGLSALIAHELSHVIGFKHISQNNSKPAADHCVASIPANGSLNGSLCQAEIELVHYEYGLRDGVVDPAQHIATGVEVAGPTSLIENQSGTLTVTAVLFNRAAPWFTPLDASIQKFTWSRDNPAVVTLGTSITSTNTVHAENPGITTIHITPNLYQKAVPFDGDITFTVTAIPTAPPPPTSLSASAITATSATISWVNGATNAGTTTTLQYRQSGVSAWTTASSTIGAGVTSHNLTNLASLTTYDVRAWHVRSGLSSTTTTRTGLFTTPAPTPPTITNFRVTGCEQEVVGLKTFNHFTLSWSSTATGGSFQIGVNTTSSSSGAAVILTVPGTARSGQVGGYLAGPTTVHRWFWIRYGSGPWIALAGNPLATNVCAL
jgi:hypothetical protein